MYLLQAYEQLKYHVEISLLLIGRGQPKNELQQYMQSEELKDVRFLDYVPNEQLIVHYTSADVFFSSLQQGHSKSHGILY